MDKNDIMSLIKKGGLIIESSEYSENELKFYCNDGKNRFFVNIKDKEV